MNTIIKAMSQMGPYFACILGILFLSTFAFGADNYWTAAGGGSFTNANNWSALAVPTAADVANFTNNSVVSVSVNTAATNSDCNVTSDAGSLDMNIVPGATWVTINALNIPGLDFKSPTLSLTNGGAAWVGGAIDVGGNFGHNSGCALLISGGALIATNNSTRVGYWTPATLTQSGGRVLLYDLTLGLGGSGAFNLSGGTNEIIQNVYLGNNVGAVGQITMTDGLLLVTNRYKYIYMGSYGRGTLSQSGGNAIFYEEHLGVFAGAKGTLNLSGGTHQALASSQVGNLADSTGSVSVTGGQWVTTNDVGSVVFTIGDAGVGDVTVSNGQWLANAVRLGGAATGKGTLTIAGGQVLATSVTAGNVAGANNNIVLVTGGVLEANTLSIAASTSGNVISNSGAIYQFNTSTPTITPASGSIALNGGIIAFRGVTAANVNDAQLANISCSGVNAFRLDAATNATAGQNYTFATNLGAAIYTRLELLNGAMYRGGTATIGSGGRLVVSNGTATISNLVLQAGGTYPVTLNSTNDYTKLVAVGSVDLTGSTLQVTLGSIPDLNGFEYTIIRKDSAGAVTGQFTAGSVIMATYNGREYPLQVRYTGGAGGDVYLVYRKQGTVLILE